MQEDGWFLKKLVDWNTRNCFTLGRHTSFNNSFKYNVAKNYVEFADFCFQLYCYFHNNNNKDEDKSANP